MKSYRTLCETWFQRVWTNQETAAVHELFVPDKKDNAHGLKKEAAVGPEGFVLFRDALLKQIENVEIKIDQYLQNEEWVTMRLTMNFDSQINDQKEISVPMAVVVRIEDDKIREAHNFLDFMHFYEKLGILPENTLMKSMTGARFVEDSVEA